MNQAGMKQTTLSKNYFLWGWYLECLSSNVEERVTFQVIILSRVDEKVGVVRVADAEKREVKYEVTRRID